MSNEFSACIEKVTWFFLFYTIYMVNYIDSQMANLRTIPKINPTDYDVLYTLLILLGFIY